MMAPLRQYSPDTLQRTAYGAIVIATLTAALYYGKDVLVPVTLAVLLSFVVSPLVNRLRRFLPQGPAVAAVVLCTVIAVGIVGFALARQVLDLGNDLPKYEVTLREKLKNFRTGAAQSGVIDRATATLRGLGQELEPQKPTSSAGPANSLPQQQRPIPVEVRQPPDGPLEIYQRIIQALLAPMTTTAIVLIMVIFILIQKDDIRDRVIRLAGTRDLQVTTAALNDAASRLSRLFLAQTILNSAFGVVIALGLWIIGVPSPVLWGVFAGLMRFVPYIGALLASIFPILLAASVDPGWSLAIQTIALFAIIEPLTGHFIEPWLYGQSTGLSPLAIVVSAVIWTTLWGPIGLLIATPITMCLVVLGRHIQGLKFLDVILGDEPALAPDEVFYQRLASGASTQASEQAQEFLKTGSLLEYFDTVALPGIRLAAIDAERGVIDESKIIELREGIDVLIDDIAGERQSSPEATPSSSDETTKPELVRPIAQDELHDDFRSDKAAVLCVGSRTHLDTASAEILAAMLSAHGVNSRSGSVKKLSDLRQLDLSQVKIVWLCSTEAIPAHAHIRYLVRHIRRIAPNILICGGFWPHDSDMVQGIGETAVDFSAATLTTLRLARKDVTKQELHSAA